MFEKMGILSYILRIGDVDWVKTVVRISSVQKSSLYKNCFTKRVLNIIFVCLLFLLGCWVLDPTLFKSKTYPNINLYKKKVPRLKD